jgi:hypothetical protein
MRLTAILLGCLSLAGPAIAQSKSEAPPKTRSARVSVVQGWEPAVGQDASIVNPQGGSVYVAFGDTAWTSLKNAVKANDKVGVDQLIEGKAAAAIPSATPVLVLKPIDRRQMPRFVDGRMRSISVPTSWEVRIKDGTLKDRVAIVSADYVGKLASEVAAASSAKRASKTFKADRPANKASNAFQAAKKFDTDKKLSEAVRSYNGVIRDYPDSPEARMAAARVKALTEK